MADNLKVENTKILLRDRGSRNRIFIAAAVVLVMIVAGILLFATGSKKTKAPPASVSVSTPPQVSSIPGTSTDPVYQSLQEQKNQQALDEARKNHTSSIPVLTGSTDGVNDPMASVKSTPPPVVKAPEPINPVQKSAPPPINPIPSASEINNGAGSSDRQHQYANAQKQFETYMSAFALKPGKSEFVYYGKQPKVTNADGASGASGASASGSAASGGGNMAAAGGSDKASSSVKGASFVRAGTVIPAVLLTPINSDTPGPVLAEITSGPLAGARLLGTFRASRNQVVLTFNQISMRSQPASFKVQAYAVDANTFSPGLATDVNNHYLVKYGLLAASEFISGYGKAVGQQGTTTVVGPLGGATVINNGLDNAQIAKSALGQVGTSLANQVKTDTSQLKPTIKVEGAHGQGGVPIGLLFMSDF